MTPIDGNTVGSRSIKGSGIKKSSGSHVAGGGDGGGKRRGLAFLLPLAGLLLVLLLALAAVLIAFNALDKGDRSGLDFRNDKKASSEAGTAGGQPAGSRPAPTNSQGTQAGQAGTSGPGNLVAGGRNVVDEAVAGRLAQLNGQATVGQGVTVQSVVADEGFWVGPSEQSRAFIFLSPQARSKPGESPFQVKAGQQVDLTGVVKPVPADLTPFGVDQAEGSGQLRSQGHYVEANSVRLG